LSRLVKNDTYKRVLPLVLAAWIATSCAGQDRSLLLAKATQIFGPRLTEHNIFKLNDRYVLWLITAQDGRLIEITVGPKSFYTSEFPREPEMSRMESLSKPEFEEALSRISELRELGRLKQQYYKEIPGLSGPIVTDEYQKAFVENVLHPADSNVSVGDVAWQFSVYYIEEVSGSPKQLALSEDEPTQVCLGSAWYYLPRDEATRVHVGKWTKFRGTDTESRVSRNCFRTTTLYDADGFTIEEPENETIEFSQPISVRLLAGRVQFGEASVEGANVEILAAGTKNVMRTKTDANGKFKLPYSHKGSYKFKVTKDGFKALTGTILIDPNASEGSLSFELPVGT